MSSWNPWRGCHRFSTGCKHCYIHKGDAKREIDTNNVVKTDNYYAPVARKKNGEYKMKSDQLVNLCFSSDFLIEDADPWRDECWAMMKERQDLRFLFLTKRIERFSKCMPKDWGDGYDNVFVGCTVENQETADFRLAIFDKQPIKHKNIICQPLLERLDISKHLDGVELVTVGGESDRYARPIDYDWVLELRTQCMNANVSFVFRQCGTHFIKDGRQYILNVRQLCSQARKADIDFTAVKND